MLVVVVAGVVVVVVVVITVVVVVVSGGVVEVLVVGTGLVVSSPASGQVSVELNIFGSTGSEVTSLRSWQISEVSLYLTNTHPLTATHFLHSASESQLAWRVVVMGLDAVVLVVELFESAGEPNTWQPNTSPIRRYLSMFLRLPSIWF